VSISKKLRKIQLAENVSGSLPKIPTGKSSHIYPLISPLSSHLPPNNEGCSKPEAYCSSPLSSPKYKE
jgi:hypothetical protein